MYISYACIAWLKHPDTKGRRGNMVVVGALEIPISFLGLVSVQTWDDNSKWMTYSSWEHVSSPSRSFPWGHNSPCCIPTSRAHLPFPCSTEFSLSFYQPEDIPWALLHVEYYAGASVIQIPSTVSITVLRQSTETKKAKKVLAQSQDQGSREVMAKDTQWLWPVFWHHSRTFSVTSPELQCLLENSLNLAFPF